MSNYVDVAVVGGGPAGVACAIRLARRGYRVVLFTTGASAPRSDLLSPVAAAALEELGFPFEKLEAVANPCCGIVDCWLPGAPTYTDFELTRFRLGWVVDRNGFDESLVQFATECNVHVVQAQSDARLVDSPRDLKSTLTVYCNGDHWTTRFVVDATGSAGKLLPKDNNRRAQYDRLIAVRVSLSGALRPYDWMHLAISNSGWWYTLSPKFGPAQAVFMTDRDLLPRKQDILSAHLANEFRVAFPNQHCSLELSKPIDFRNARTTFRRNIWIGRWLPIGDARVSIDPLTGAGLERAFSSANTGASLVENFLESGSFRDLEANAVDFFADFQLHLAKLQRNYTMAVEHTPSLNGRFWQRRTYMPGIRDLNEFGRETVRLASHIITP